MGACGAEARTRERYNRLTGDRVPIRLRPSAATSIAHGFATIARFFPGARDELAAIDDAIVCGALGPTPRERRTASRISTPRPAVSCTS